MKQNQFFQELLEASKTTPTTFSPCSIPPGGAAWRTPSSGSTDAAPNIAFHLLYFKFGLRLQANLTHLLRVSSSKYATLPTSPPLARADRKHQTTKKHTPAAIRSSIATTISTRKYTIAAVNSAATSSSSTGKYPGAAVSPSSTRKHSRTLSDSPLLVVVFFEYF
ncbi:uncharacterized protein LOC127256046 [Andrographis paniculata]|uniref:uncharacterized protein LOC127256046 n=1 Tax=Andrographis paniculata TaxID=175694 RepID=UPI0021E8A729|nr:uncharacterized protein LOC127256046 [Andrographis paniculata]